MRTKKIKDRWYWYRYDVLLVEGFTPEEASVLSHVRISSRQVRTLRRSRKRVMSYYIKEGMTPSEALGATQRYFSESDDEILTWTDFRDILYPRNDLRTSVL